MGFADNYLQKHAAGEPLIPSAPDPALHSIIAIPAYNESGLSKCLDSLFSCTSPDTPAEVIVLINSGEQTPPAIVGQNRSIYQEALEWCASHTRPGITFHVVLIENLPRKHFGAGLARKLVMDEAVRRFNQVDHAAGIILSLDADTLVEQNYLREVTGFFDRAPDMDGCSIRFAHPLEPMGSREDRGEKVRDKEGRSEEEHAGIVYDAIVNYELHQRYYLEAVRYTGYPYAYHTVGSAFAVRALAYCRQGGMSKRQAGEDFYFIQKVALLGNYSECNTTTVHPSPRPSDRVPFGTGPAIAQQLAKPGAPFLTYAPVLFRDLRTFFSLIPAFYACGTNHVTEHNRQTAVHSNDIPCSPATGTETGTYAGTPNGPHQEPGTRQHSGPEAVAPSGPPAVQTFNSVLCQLPDLLRKYLETKGFIRELTEIRRNVAGEAAFRKRFFRKFNMFWILKYLHFAGEQGINKVEVGAAAREMLKMKGLEIPAHNSLKELLSIYRQTGSAGY